MTSATKEGAKIFKRLAGKADVVIETFKPGYMDSLGIGYRQLAEDKSRTDLLPDSRLRTVRKRCRKVRESAGL